MNNPEKTHCIFIYNSMHEYACAFVHLSMHVYPPHKYIHILGIKLNQRGKNDIYQKLQNTDERTPKEGLSIFIDY